MFTYGFLCSHCSDPTDLVTPQNGTTMLASIGRGELIVALHGRCEAAWADKAGCRTLVPLRQSFSRTRLRKVAKLSSALSFE